MNKKELLTYNLQTFAEGSDDTTKEDKTEPEKNNDSTPEDKAKPETKDKPDAKGDSLPDMQQLMNDYAKLKRSFDKTSSELAATKKALKEKMTEQEIASQEKAEAEAAEAERVAGIEKENKIFKATNVYLGLGYTNDEANRMALAEVDGDLDARTKIMKEVEDRKTKELEAKFYAERPDLNAGSGSDVLTQEKFDQMDMIEKSKLRKSDPNAYERFIGRKAI